MKNKFVKKKRKIRKPINNYFLWIWLWCLWTTIAMIIVPFTFDSFNSLKTVYWWWLVMSVILATGLTMLIFWIRNLRAWKAENILNDQANLK